jgi:hypothetical protein
VDTSNHESGARNNRSELLVYRTQDGAAAVRLKTADGSAWLSQLEMAELFDTTKQNVSLHIQNILDEGELPEATVKESLTAQTEGTRQVQRKTLLYNLHMILAVGYRVRSPRGIEFRQWTTSPTGAVRAYANRMSLSPKTT